MFAQFSRFAEQGTVLMFTSGPSHGEALGDLFGDVLYHASLSQQEYRQLLNDHGFEVVEDGRGRSRLVLDIRCGWHRSFDLSHA